VHRLAKETVRGIYREAADAEDEGRRKELAKHATRSEAEARIRATLELAKSELPISPDELDADPWLLNCKNGTIDLRTGELRAHRRGDLVTRLVPTEFDPAARLATWDRFLSDATNGKDGLEAFLRRGVGYSLTGDMGEKVLFFIHGPKDAGKTTFLEAIKAALGDYSDTIGFDALLERGQRGGPRPEIAQLPGKRFVASSEVKEGSKMAVEVVKALTGWDQLQVRNVYERPFSFVPQCKLWLAANHAPRVPVDDDATWDRILRIPFENTVPKSRRDPDVQRILRDPEQSGAAILAWAVRGCAEWRREGLGVPQVVKAATDEYREDMDPLGDFMADYCVLGPDLWVHSGQLREAYEKWARETGEQSLVRGKKWGAGLRAHGCTPDTTPDKKSRIWRGIALKHGPGDGHEWRPAERVPPARTDSVQGAETAANGEEAHDLSDGSSSESVKFPEDFSYEGEFRDNVSESVRRGESVQDHRVDRVEEDAGEGLQELLAEPPEWLRRQADKHLEKPSERTLNPLCVAVAMHLYGDAGRWQEVKPAVERWLEGGEV
jgi:putative DNA primase/helicase